MSKFSNKGSLQDDEADHEDDEANDDYNDKKVLREAINHTSKKLA